MDNELNSVEFLKQYYGLLAPTVHALANLQDAVAELLPKNPELVKKLKANAAELKNRIEALQQAAERSAPSKGTAQEEAQ